jgi:hypothetical protein
MSSAATLRVQIESALAQRIPGALSPRTHSSPELLPIGIEALDTLLQGGIPRGGVTEISGYASTGRTTLTLSLLAEVTGKGSACAWVDVQDMFDPESAAACGVVLHQLLWIRARQSSPPFTSGEIFGRNARPNNQQKQKPWSRLDQALKATDLLLQTGGFPVVVLDMGNLKAEHALRVPIASWYRFRLAAEQAQTALVLLTRTPCAKSCASLVLRCLQPHTMPQWSVANEAPLFTEINFQVLRERRRNPESQYFATKKPPLTQDAAWVSQTQWMS